VDDVTGSPSSIVVVEDDRGVREMLSAVLTSEGYEVSVHADGESVLEDPTAMGAGLVILDVGLPGVDGFGVCDSLRRAGRTGAVLMLTARHEITDRVKGLDAGADDYLVKPFALDELLARVRAALRREAAPTERAPANHRSTGRSDESETVLALDDLTVDLAVRRVTRGRRTIELTKLEFDLLALLVANSPRVLPRDLILTRVWGYEIDLGSNSLEVFISNLRKKLEMHGEERLIETVRGIGYAARRTGAGS
jgi:two-component system response regulator MprA